MPPENALLRPYAVPGREPPFRLSRGSGSIVYDDCGRRYLDAAGGLWNVTLGLNHDAVFASIAAQAKQLSYASLFDSSHPVAERLAERLLKAAGGDMAFAYLSTTGSSAVEVALRIARLHFRARGLASRRRIISYDSGYHGCTHMNLSASGIMHQEMAGWEDVSPEFTTVSGPQAEAESLAAIRAVFAAEKETIAALLIEPILGSGGVVVPSSSYCRELNALCREADVLLIADEVATGGGRCGSMFASHLVGLEPDAIALSKGLSSGFFPIGATVLSKRMMEPLVRGQTPLFFGSTQDGNPIGCAAAMATLDAIQDGGLIARATEVGDRIKDGLGDLIGRSVLSEISGLGLMLGLHLNHPSDDQSCFTEIESAAVREECRQQGLLVYHFAGGISLFPAMTVTDEEVEDIVDILGQVLATQA